MNARSLVIVAVSAGLAVAACGSQSTSSPSSSAAPSPTPPAIVTAASGMVSGQTKTFLVNNQGMTLYYFTPDKGGNVTCTAACAANWPADIIGPAATVPTSVAGFSGSFGTVANPAGGNQLTYQGWPLYTYASDKAPGDTTGDQKGGKWFVAAPDIPNAMTASSGGSSYSYGY